MSDKTQKCVLLAAGGTAGHMFPADSLAAELIRRGCKVVLVTDKRGENYQLTAQGVEKCCIAAGGIAGKGLMAKLRSGVELLWGTLQSILILRNIKPDAVIGFGGYASVPTMMAARFVGCPMGMHEQNAVLGRANRLFTNHVLTIATCYEKVDEIPPDAEQKVIRTGLPVRQAVTDAREVAFPKLEQNKEIRILVTGGSQGARVFSDVVPDAIGLLDDEMRKRIFITQQCRAEDLARVKSAYKNIGVKVILKSFFGDLPEEIAISHLVIGRAGASTTAELLMIGRPAILVPYPHAIDDHQSRNAHAVDEAGAGWLMPEAAFTAEALAERLGSLFSMPTLINKAAASARTAGTPDATTNLADMVYELMNHKLTNKNSISHTGRLVA